MLDELVPSALHTVERHANNPVEADHGRLKARLRPMRGLKRHSSVRVLAAGHAFVQNLRRGHYDIGTEVPSAHRLRIAFDDLALTICASEHRDLALAGVRGEGIMQQRPPDHLAGTIDYANLRQSAGNQTIFHRDALTVSKITDRVKIRPCKHRFRDYRSLPRFVITGVPVPAFSSVSLPLSRISHDPDVPRTSPGNQSKLRRN